MNILDFTLGAITLAVGLIAKPYIDVVVMRIRRVFTAKKHKSPHDMLMEHNIEELVERMNELETTVNNLVEVKYNREKNRKYNIRREVRDYLKELRSDN